MMSLVHAILNVRFVFGIKTFMLSRPRLPRRTERAAFGQRIPLNQGSRPCIGKTPSITINESFTSPASIELIERFCENQPTNHYLNRRQPYRPAAAAAQQTTDGSTIKFEYFIAIARAYPLTFTHQSAISRAWNVREVGVRSRARAREIVQNPPDWISRFVAKIAVSSGPRLLR
uniref:Putative secreted protein n=1 Tax=Anopheles triannulatus TaxID=58253 RepID=A0A2M4B5F9_9DIPT